MIQINSALKQDKARLTDAVAEARIMADEYNGKIQALEDGKNQVCAAHAAACI